MGESGKLVLVQAAVRQALGLLQADDRVCVISFDSDAQRVTPLLRVRGAGLERLLSQVRVPLRLQAAHSLLSAPSGHGMPVGGSRRCVVLSPYKCPVP